MFDIPFVVSAVVGGGCQWRKLGAAGRMNASTIGNDRVKSIVPEGIHLCARHEYLSSGLRYHILGCKASILQFQIPCWEIPGVTRKH